MPAACYLWMPVGSHGHQDPSLALAEVFGRDLMQSKRSRSSKKFWSCPVLLVATPGPLRSWICIDRKSLQRKWESPQCVKGSSTGGLILKRTRRSCSDRVKTASTSRTANLQERYTPLPSLMLFLMLKIGKYFQYITTNCIVDPQSFFSPISVLNTSGLPLIWKICVFFCKK